MREEMENVTTLKTSEGRPLLVYSGNSMNPTLKHDDLLDVVPASGSTIKRGDVIVFSPPNIHYKIVHRVISRNSGGICTRGDNSGFIDPWMLSDDDVIGIVLSIWRGNKRKRIRGGFLGFLFLFPIKLARKLDNRIICLLHTLYEWLCQKGIFHDVWYKRNK
jgi:hypothetical protein